MKTLTAMVILLIAVLAPAQAQPEQVCEGAQDWYDQSFEYMDLILESLSVADDPDPNAWDLLQSFDEMKSASEEVEQMDYPNCVAAPRYYYLKAFDSFQGAISLAVLPETRARMGKSLVFGSLYLGRALGYLEALGVDT